MKLKYYLRGLGMGILLSTIVLSISFRINQNNQSEKDNENVKQETDNTEEDVELEDLLTPTTEQKDNTTESTTADTKATEQNSSKDENNIDKNNIDKNNIDQNNIDQSKTSEIKVTDSDSSKAEPTQGVKTDVTLETQVSNSTNTKNEAAKIEESEKSAETAKQETPKAEVTNYVIQITKGMTSEDVARVLKNNNIIDDSLEFNQYLKANGYSTTIDVGSYEISQNASYQQIADKITNK